MATTVELPHAIVPPAILARARLRFYLACAHGILFPRQRAIRRFGACILTDMETRPFWSREELLLDLALATPSNAIASRQWVSMSLGVSRFNEIIRVLDTPSVCAGTPVNITERLGRLCECAC